MRIREVEAKTILNKSGLTDYCVNPYMGCSFACSYCYAQLIIRKFHPKETWGEYVDIKINAPELLEKELAAAKRGVVMLSTVIDPYQPLEKKYQLTRKCLEILLRRQFPVTVLTRSPLVTRDIDLFKQFKDCTIGVSITTNDDKIKQLFEPLTPPFSMRIDTLRKLHSTGLRTYAFIGPILPMNPSAVAEAVAPYVEHVFIDKLNYPQLWKAIGEKNGLVLDSKFFEKIRNELIEAFQNSNNRIKINALF